MKIMLLQLRGKGKVRTRVLSAFLAFVMVFGLLPTVSLRAEAASTTESFSVNGASGVKTLTAGGTYTITGGTTTAGYSIKIPAGAAVTINVTGNTTINNWSIDTVFGAPIDIAYGGKLILNVASGATLDVRGGNYNGINIGFPGIRVPKGAELEISGPGTVKAYGMVHNDPGGTPAAIGACGTAEYTGETAAAAGLDTRGGSLSGSYWNEDAGKVTIWSNAVVYAYGGASSTDGTGAGIGGGGGNRGGGHGGTVIIYGKVEAYGGGAENYLLRFPTAEREIQNGAPGIGGGSAQNLRMAPRSGEIYIMAGANVKAVGGSVVSNGSRGTTVWYAAGNGIGGGSAWANMTGGPLNKLVIQKGATVVAKGGNDYSTLQTKAAGSWGTPGVGIGGGSSAVGNGGAVGTAIVEQGANVTSTNGTGQNASLKLPTGTVTGGATTTGSLGSNGTQTKPNVTLPVIQSASYVNNKVYVAFTDAKDTSGSYVLLSEYRIVVNGVHYAAEGQNGFVSADVTGLSGAVSVQVEQLVGNTDGILYLTSTAVQTTAATIHNINSSALNITANGAYHVNGTGTATANRITVANNLNNVAIVLHGNVNIQAAAAQSAMSIGTGSTVKMLVTGTNRFYGGIADIGASDALTGDAGARGAGAGIAVPTGAALTVEGSGTLYAYGGDAGDGGNCTPSGNRLAGGGGGAGAGIGGVGGNGAAIANDNTPAGGAGGSAGTITINARVQAYGGGGGSGGYAGHDEPYDSFKGAGGGGYPAAGIGGGGGAGGGGDHCLGGGGFSGGAGRLTGTSAVDGSQGASTYAANGGGYFSADDSTTVYEGTYGIAGALYGGGGKWQAENISKWGTGGGDGGPGGAGGNITIMDATLVTAQNGSKITTSTSAAQGYASANATPIRTQSTQGYGAGAGFTETNGSIQFLGAPGAPTSVGAILSGTYKEKVKVTWTAPTDNGGSAITGYTLVSTAFGANVVVTPAQCTVSGSTLSYEVGNLPANTAGTFVVYTNNIKGSSAPSAASNSVTTWGTPLATQNVAAEDVTKSVDATVRVFWNAPDTSKNQNAITSYRIMLSPVGIANLLTEEKLDCELVEGTEESGTPQYKPSPAESKTVTVAAADLAIDGASGKYYVNVNGLERGTVYNVTVLAENGAGTAKEGGSALVETSAGAMAPSVTVAHKNASVNDLTVTWTEPENVRTPGLIPALTGYTVTRTAVDEQNNAVTAEKKVWSFTPTDSALTIGTDAEGVKTFTFTDNTLGADALNGRTYTYTVTGDNLTGHGDEGKGSYSYGPIAPTGVTRKPNTTLTNSLTLQWTAPAENGNDPIQGYYVYRDGEKLSSTMIPKGTTVCTDTNVEPGVTYKYTVVAVNGDGEGLLSTPELSLRANNVPLSPATFVVKADKRNSLTAVWSAPNVKDEAGLPGTGGFQPDGTTELPLLRYRLQWKNRSSGVIGEAELAVVLVPGVGYVPAKSDGTAADTIDNVYTVCLNPSETQESQKLYFTYNPSSGEYKYTMINLARGAGYDLTVTAVNEVGQSEAKAYSQSTWGTPGMPANLTLTTITSTAQLQVSWEPSSPNGGEAVTQYDVRVYLASDYQTNGTGATPVDDTTMSASASTMSWTTTELDAQGGMTYAVVVTPRNALGDGQQAVAYNTTTGVPSAPVTVAADAYAQDQDAWITARWGDVSNNGGSPITRYEVRVYRFTNLDDPNGPVTELTAAAPTQSPAKPVGNEPVVLTYPNGVTVTYPKGLLESRTARIEGLEGWKDYRISVWAYNEANDTGDHPIPGAANYTIVRTPSAPYEVQELKAAANGAGGELTVTWRAPLNNGGAAVSRYRLELYSGKYTEEEIQDGAAAGKLLIGGANAVEVTSNELTYTFTGLTNGEDYTARVMAVNSVGVGRGSAASGRPAEGAMAPTNPAVQLKDGTSLDFTWTNPTADGYKGGTLNGYIVTLTDERGAALYTMTTDANGNITSSVETGSSGIGMALTAPADYVGGKVTVHVTGLTMGGQYRLRANVTTAQLPGIPGAPSEDVRFRMWTKPGAPSGIQVVPTVTDQGLKVQWKYPINDGDSDSDPKTNSGDLHTGVTEYRLYWRHEGEPGWKLMQWGAGLDELRSKTAGIVTGEANVTVSDGHAVGSGVDNGVYYIHLNGLTDGDTYEFQVIAMNGAGWGAADRIYSANPCSVPTKAEIGEVLTGDRSATVTSITGHYTPGEKVTVDGEEVLGNGGSPVTGYRIYAAPAVKNGEGAWVPGGAWAFKAATTAEATENVRVPDLENGTDYLIKVCAINAACTDEAANLGREGSNWEYVRVGMPLKPENVKADLGMANSAIVTYDAAEGHGSPILYYKAYVAQLSGPDAAEPGDEAYSEYTMQLVNGLLVDTGEAIRFNGQTATVYGATMGDTVSIRFTAVNAVGESPMSEVVRVTVGAPSIPSIRVLDKAQDKVHIEWTAANGNGARMQSYHVYLRNEAGTEYHYRVGAAYTELDLTAATEAVGEKAPLNKGIKYFVQVSAENLAGEGPRSEARSFIFGVPQPPTINDVEFGVGELTVTFTPPEDTGGVLESGEKEPLTGFAVYANGVMRELITTVESEDGTAGVGAYEGLSWKYVAANEDGTYTVTVEELANGSTYSIRVAAINQWGEGDQSGVMTGTPATLAGAPTNVTAKATSDTTAELSWRAPAYNGGSNIEGYVVTVCDAGGSALEGMEALTVNNTVASVTGLVSGQTYRFKIQAQTRAGLGTSSTTNAITTFTLPGMPGITSWESKADSNGRYNLTVTWTAPENTGGTELLGYNVYRGKVKVTATMLNPETHTYTISGLSYGASYDISVGAVNSVGETKTDPALTTRVGQLPAPKITEITTPLTEDGYTADLIVKHMPVEGAVTGYYLFNLADVDQFPDLAKKDDPTAPDVEKIMSLNASDLNRLLARSVQYHQYLAEETGDLSRNEVSISYQDVGNVYYLVLAAYSTAGGVGVPTAVYPVTIGAPDAPSLSAEAGYRKITASWKAPANMNLTGGELVGYQFYLDGAALGDMVSAAELASLGNAEGGYTKELTVSGAQRGKDGVLTVAAITSREQDGETLQLAGQPSEGVTVCPWDVPTTPVSEEPVPGNASFTITFQKADGRGLPIAGYRIYWNDMARADSTVRWEDNGDGTITATVTGVENGYKGKDEEGKDVGYPVYVEAYTREADGTERRSVMDPQYVHNVATGIPAAPVITGADANTNSIRVTWENSAVSSTITQYTVYLKNALTTQEQSYTAAATDTSLLIDQFNGLALEQNRVYLVTVTATSAIGESARSESVSVLLGAPKAPGNVNAISGNGSATVTWTAPDAVTTPIIKYHIYVVGEDGTTLTREVDRNTTAFTVDGLENGVRYAIQVTAENSAGEGVRSTAVNVIPGTAPGAPASAAAAAESDTAVKVSWTKPADDGGLPVSYYTVRGGGRTVAVSAGDFAADAEEFTAEITGLTAGTTYTFTVTATNTAGTSEPCETNAVTTHTVPSTPMWEEVYSEDGDIVVMWKAPASAGGAEAKIESYTLYVRNYAGELLYTISGIESNASNTDGNGVITYIIDGDDKGETPLELYTKYRVSVAAKNDSVDTVGPENDRFVVTVIGALAASKPGNPIELQAAAGDQQVVLSWKAPVRDGGGVDAYYIYYSTKDEGAARQSEPQRIRVDGSRLTETVTSLTNGTAYEFYVTASNAQGESGPSLTEEATPLHLSAPGAVKNMRYFNTAAGQTVFLWDAPVTGDAPQYYKVTVTNLGTGKVEFSDESFTAASLRMSNLNPSLQYRIEVIASNTGGDSPAEAITAMSVLNVDTDGTLTDFDRDKVGNLDADFDGVADPVDQVTAPSEPTNLSSTVNGADSITLTWTAPANNGGAGIELSGYRIYVNGTYVEIAAQDENGQAVTSYTYDNSGSGLTPGSVYTFQVSAMNDEAGEGARSTVLQVYVQASDAPRNLEASASNYTTLNLSWDKPETAEPIEGYYLQINGKDSETAMQLADVSAEHLTYSEGGLKPDSETVVRVFAKFQNGRTGQYSDAVVVSTAVETPAAPEITDMTAETTESGDTVTVIWNAVENATAYKVHVSVAGGEGQDATVTGTDHTFTFETTQGIYTAYVIAVNAPESTNVSKESARSAVKSATTMEISANYAPEQVTGLEAAADRGNGTVSLSWTETALPDGASGGDFSLKYIVYGGTQETGLQVMAVTEETSATVNVELNQDYAFQVVAVSAYTGSETLDETPVEIQISETESLTGFPGLRSDVVEVSTKSQIAVPDAPANLSGSYSNGEVTLRWNAPAGTITGYRVYVYKDGQPTVITTELVEGTSYTFTPELVEGKTDYLYQVSAVVVDDETGEEIESARSAALTVSTAAPPAAPDAPTILRYVFSMVRDEENSTPDKEVLKGIIKLYWKAPEKNGNVANENITGYTVLLENQEMAGPVEYSAETDEWFYTFDCNKDNIFQGETYAVAVQSRAEVDGVTLVSGLQEQTYKIAYGNNYDTDGDGKADSNFDNDGDGVVEDVAVTVKLTGTIVAKNSNPNGTVTFTITDEAGSEVSSSKFNVEMDESGNFTLSLQVDAATGDGKYTLKAAKVGCTSFSITNIPISAAMAPAELGSLVLYAGDIDGNDVVNVDDMLAVKSNMNKRGENLAADIDKNGVINVDDMLTVKGNLNKRAVKKAWSSL